MNTRTVRNCILAIVFVALCVVIFVDISQRRRTPDAAVQVVYVDADKLVSLHPAWLQLKLIEELAEGLNKIPLQLQPEAPGAVHPDKTDVSFVTVPEIERRALQSQLSTDAEKQIGIVEDLLRKSVKERVDARSQELREEFAQELLEERRLVSQQVLDDIRKLHEGTMVDKVNEELRKIAVQRSLAVSGQDKIGLGDHLAEIENANQIKSDSRKNAEKEIMRQAGSRLAELQKRQKEKLDEEVSKLALEEDGRVALQMMDYRERLMQIVNGNGFGELPNYDTSDILMAPTYSDSGSASKNENLINIAVQEILDRRHRLQRQIVDDLSKLMARVAVEQNLELVFVKNNKYKDYTQHFAEIIAIPSIFGAALMESGAENGNG